MAHLLIGMIKISLRYISLFKSLNKNCNLRPCRCCKFFGEISITYNYSLLLECLTNVLLLLQAFAIFCGMAIHNTVMYENVNKAMAKQKVALEVRNFFQNRFFSSLLFCECEAQRPCG